MNRPGPRLLLALRNVVVVAQRSAGTWSAHEVMQGKQPRCLVRDPLTAGRVYCGTANEGLWASDDFGDTWRQTAALPHARVTAVTVAPAESAHGKPAVVYAGTEPSTVSRSADGGETWETLDAMNALPSSSTWAFPPRPSTHHVRSLAADPHHPGRIWACIEAGALVRSDDSGRTWHDRVPGGPYDTHTLVPHPVLAGRLYAAAGDGWFESDDAGTTWRSDETGLELAYLVSVAVDPRDPGHVLVSAAPHAHRAYDPPSAETAIYMKGRDRAWSELGNGLPARKNTAVAMIAATAPGVFWVANNRGVYHSTDGSGHWTRLDVPWKDAYTRNNVLALLADVSA